MRGWRTVCCCWMISPELTVRRKEVGASAGYRGGGARGRCCLLVPGRTAQGAKPRKLRLGVDTWIIVVQLFLRRYCRGGMDEKRGSGFQQVAMCWPNVEGSGTHHPPPHSTTHLALFVPQYNFLFTSPYLSRLLVLFAKRIARAMRKDNFPHHPSFPVSIDPFSNSDSIK